MLSVISGLCYVLVVILSLPFMKSVTDSFYHSPFQKGFFYILSLGLGMMGIIYGYASNRFHRINQVVDGMAFLFPDMRNISWLYFLWYSSFPF